MSGFLGKDGFAWFFGVVEDRKDPLKLGRVRVRVFGYHNEDKNVLPTNELPWATPVQPVTSAALSGVGSTPFGLVEGTWVLGFFTDPGSYQIPMILGSIGGLNTNPLSKLGEAFGNAFKDLRSQEQINNAPNNILEKREYPDGKSKNGDEHGAQLKTSEQNSSFPRSTYDSKASGSATGTPDTNILGVNDKKRIDKTAVGIKNTPLDSGGTRETAVSVADIDFDKFSTGVINQSGVNKGTNKNLATGYNGVESSSKPSLKQNYKQFKDQPTNANGKTIFSNNTSTTSGIGAISPVAVSISASANCYKDNMNNVTSGVSAIATNIASITNATVSGYSAEKTKTDIQNSRTSSISSYVPTADGSSPINISGLGITSNQERFVKDASGNLISTKSSSSSTGTSSTGTSLTDTTTQTTGQQTTGQGIIDENGNPIIRDNSGSIIINGNIIPVIDVTNKIGNQIDKNNPNRNNECGDCGCKDGNCK
jgi:hypothetical protein